VLHQSEKNQRIKDRKKKLAIVVSSYNPEITKKLLESCVRSLVEGRIFKKNLKIVEVPGAFEIPLAVKKLASSKKYDAIIALGAIIKGETHHFEIIAQECARGIMQTMLGNNIPIIFGVLTTYTKKQALERCKLNQKNKGREAAQAALHMLNLL